jgi:PAS domain S-box-containing protein
VAVRPTPPSPDQASLADDLAATRLELQRLQRLFRGAFSHQFQFMAILSAEGRVLDFNEQFAPGARLPRDEVVGRLFWETAWWQDQPHIVEAWPLRLQAAAASDAAVVYHDQFTSPDGEPRWAEASVHALRDEQGRAEGFVVQATDTTEQRRAEAQREAAEKRLRDTQTLLAIGTLAGGIAHDFNNILGAIRGNLTLALDSLPPEHAARPPLAQIERASLRGRSLVRQILDFSRKEAGKLRVQPLQPLVEETVSLLRPSLPPGVKLLTRLEPGAAWARVNASQVHQVLMNLCINACQALPAASGEIVVGVERLPDGRSHLWVADDGTGMDAETLRRVFEPFFTTKSVDAGTGLGMSVVHGIVSAHGGTVTVDSAPKRGTTVHVHLPCAQHHDEAGDSRAAELPADGGEGRHVLYLDDDEVIAVLAGQLLQRGGYRVTTFVDPAAALEALRDPAQGFDAIVTDFNMPGHNGLDVIRALKGLAPALPVVLTSGYIDDRLREEAGRLGVQRLFNKEDLREALCRAVDDAMRAPPPAPR